MCVVWLFASIAALAAAAALAGASGVLGSVLGVSTGFALGMTAIEFNRHHQWVCLT